MLTSMVNLNCATSSEANHKIVQLENIGLKSKEMTFYLWCYEELIIYRVK